MLFPENLDRDRCASKDILSVGDAEEKWDLGSGWTVRLTARTYSAGAILLDERLDILLHHHDITFLSRHQVRLDRTRPATRNADDVDETTETTEDHWNASTSGKRKQVEEDDDIIQKGDGQTKIQHELFLVSLRRGTHAAHREKVRVHRAADRRRPPDVRPARKGN